MKKTFLSLAVAAMIIFEPLPVSGQNEAAQNRTQRARINFTQARGQLISDRCETLLERVGKVSEAMTAGQSRYVNLANNLKTKLERFSVRAENAGVEVGELETDLTELDTLTGNLSTIWEYLAGVLSNMNQGVDCESEDLDPRGIHDAIEAAKDAKTDLRGGLKELIKFVNTDIKDDLTAIRQQLADLNQDSN